MLKISTDARCSATLDELGRHTVSEILDLYETLQFLDAR